MGELACVLDLYPLHPVWRNYQPFVLWRMSRNTLSPVSYPTYEAFCGWVDPSMPTLNRFDFVTVRIFEIWPYFQFYLLCAHLL